LTSELKASEWQASRSGRFTPGERAPDSHWVGLGADLDELEYEIYDTKWKNNLFHIKNSRGKISKCQ